MPETVSDAVTAPLKGREFVDAALARADSPVVIFSLSWCSFCRAATQLLTQHGIAFTQFELDRGEFLASPLNQEIRETLQARTGSRTLPQVFIGGERIGGYTDLSAAVRTGHLAEMLLRHGVSSTLTAPHT